MSVFKLSITRLTIIVILLILPLCVSVQGASIESEGKTFNEVYQLTQSVHELIQLIKEERSKSDTEINLQKLQIAVTYLSYRDRRREAIEKDLRSRRIARERSEEMLEKIRENPKDYNKANEKFPKPIGYSSSESWSDFRIKQLEEHMENLDSEISALEVDLATITSDLAQIEDFVDENLGVLD